MINSISAVQRKACIYTVHTCLTVSITKQIRAQLYYLLVPAAVKNPYIINQAQLLTQNVLFEGQWNTGSQGNVDESKIIK